MNEAEFYELIIQLAADVDMQFQFWLSMTFALVVTTFLAGARLGRLLRLFLVVLYVTACVLVYTRWSFATLFSQQLAEAAALEVPALPFAQTAGLVRMALFFFGTLGTCAYALLGDRFTKQAKAQP